MNLKIHEKQSLRHFRFGESKAFHFFMHFERRLLAVSEEKAVGRKSYPGDHRMLAQHIQKMREELHVAVVASFSGGNAVRNCIFDARGGNGELQVNRRLEE